VRENVILDTGPLVAIIHRDDQYHAWSTEQTAEITLPLLTCEAVLSEAYFLLDGIPNARRSLMNLVVNEMVQVPFSLREEIEPVGKLLNRYANIPMTFADACLVRMCEQHSRSTLFTTDSDFTIYRKHGRQVISVIMPARAR
jgi:predicted nucleic acid-binding protein